MTRAPVAAAVLLCLAMLGPQSSSASRVLLAGTAANGGGSGGQYAGCPEAVQAAIEDSEADEYGGPDELIHWGTAMNYSTGTVRAYTKFSAGQGACYGPVATGVELSDEVLANLPGPADVSVQPPPLCKDDPTNPVCFMPFDQLWLQFAQEDLGDFNPFPIMQLNWEPMGHIPEGVYSTPHLDIHFYLVPQDQIMNVTAGPCMGLSPEAFEAANQPLPEACFPGGAYANLMAVAPFMGNHYINMEAPEIAASMQGQNGVGAWNQTWIYGVYNGEMTYFEPMVKRAYLMTKPNECWAIPDLPREFAIGGFKPHTYCILATDEGVRIEVRDFSWYSAGCQDDSVMAPASFAQPPPGSPPLPAQCEYPKA